MTTYARKPVLSLVRPASSGPTPSDGLLVERARAGDRSAEELIYLRNVAAITALCVRLLGDVEEAEDVVQDTFVDALEQLGGLREAGNLRAWLKSIAVHKVQRRFRRRKLRRLLGLEPAARRPWPIFSPNESATPEQVLELARLSEVLARLPDSQRTAWLLRYVEGHKLKQVARLCGCSLTSAKRHISAADLVVRAHVELEDGDAT